MFDARHIQAEVGPAPHFHHAAAAELRIETVHAEGGRAVDDRVAGAQKNAAQVVQQLIRAMPSQDHLGRRAHIRAQRRAQVTLLRIRVDVVERKGRQRLAHSRRGAIRVFVGVQLDDLLGPAAQLLAQHLEGQDGRVLLKSRHIGPQQVLEAVRSLARARAGRLSNFHASLRVTAPAQNAAVESSSRRSSIVVRVACGWNPLRSYSARAWALWCSTSS